MTGSGGRPTPASWEGNPQAETDRGSPPNEVRHAGRSTTAVRRRVADRTAPRPTRPGVQNRLNPTHGVGRFGGDLERRRAAARQPACCGPARIAYVSIGSARSSIRVAPRVGGPVNRSGTVRGAIPLATRGRRAVDQCGLLDVSSTKLDTPSSARREKPQARAPRGPSQRNTPTVAQLLRDRHETAPSPARDSRPTRTRPYPPNTRSERRDGRTRDRTSTAASAETTPAPSYAPPSRRSPSATR